MHILVSLVTDLLRLGTVDRRARLSSVTSSDLGGKLQVLLSLFTVKESGNLFERQDTTVLALGLDDGPVEIAEFERDPAGVDDVVFPVESVHGDGVDVLVEDERRRDAELHDHQTLGANAEGQAGTSVYILGRVAWDER